ncbi:hypothetical protein R8Z57_06605 [Microbacterium sp. M3]|uniref:Uncharacterized protein n=1 Tax=Microbacterium arthrosphaerae TaxID=792652 RepID=A0ABU4GZE4_9MICO|nr:MULTISPECIES: hypothetical protein [Microbacterium]MDW4572451.1 hypothetical protein [Microbacterium arthrosphaerae]MDW7606306.1 hypothetical protein [Microbacterium sp. M3]
MDITDELAEADPATPSDPKVRELVRSMSVEAERAIRSNRRPFWRRRRVIIPTLVVGALTLAGAAVVVPLSLWVNGTQVDVVNIPINYTTDTGVQVSCRYGIYFGDPANRTEADEELTEFVENHDWDGIGQRIYDEAMANPFVPGPNDDWEVDNQELRDNFSFTRALSVIWTEIPEELQKSGQSAGGTTDCKGQLR